MWVLTSVATVLSTFFPQATALPSAVDSTQIQRSVKVIHADQSLGSRAYSNPSTLAAVHGSPDIVKLLNLEPGQSLPRPLPVSSYLNQGYTYAGLGNHRQAILSYLPALTLEPDNPDVLAAMGLAYWHLNDLGRAAWFLQQAHSYAPERTDIYALLITLQLRLGSFMAGAFLSPPGNTSGGSRSDCLAVLPALRFSTLQQAGDNAQASGNFTLAQRFYQQAMALEPRNPQVYLRLGNSYMAQQDYLMAIVSYRYAVQLDSTNPVPYYQLAMALKEHSRDREAEDVLERALELFSFQGNVMGVELVETALHSFKTN